MKRLYKNFTNIFLATCLLTLSVNSVQAFGFRNRAKAKVSKAKNISDLPVNTVYTRDVHSIFTLNDCVAVAIKYNPYIQASIFKEDVYKSRIGQAWANYFPSISAGIELSRAGNRYSADVPSYQNITRNSAYVPTVSANMLIFDFGKTKAIADTAKRQYEGVKEDTKEDINGIVYDIKETYYNILFAEEQVQVYRDTVKDFELQLNQAWGFYKYGKKPKLDVVTADYNLGKAKLNLIKAEEVLEIAKVKLSKIMGIPEYTNYELSEEMSLNKIGMSAEDVIKLALEVRPELISAQKEMNAAKMNLRAAKRNFTPNIGIFGSYGNDIGSVYHLRSGQVGVGLNYQGLNILKEKKLIDEASAKYKMAQAQYQNVKDSVYFNVKKTYMELKTAADTIVIAKLALDQAKEQYRQVTGRYKAGVGDAIELKDGENTYLNARLDFYNSILNYNVIAARLEREIGLPLKYVDEKVINITKEDL